MVAFLRMWNAPDVRLECKEMIVREGATVDIDGEKTTMLAVVVSDGIYHPVVDIEVL